jgi:hypothetical protein
MLDGCRHRDAARRDDLDRCAVMRVPPRRGGDVRVRGRRRRQCAGDRRSRDGDTGNPEGAPFASGKYAVTVDLYAFDRGRVTATLPIEVIP